LLKANQYTSEADFVRCGRFRFLKDPRTTRVTHRVADADFALSAALTVRAALLYDLDRPEHLIAVVTTVSREQEPDIRRIVHWYLSRWNAQENSFRAQIAFVQLNVNYGLRAKGAVPDRRVANQIAELSTHLAAVSHKLDSKLAQLAEQASRLAKHIVRYDQQLTKHLRPPQRAGPQAARRAAKRQQQLQDLRQHHQQRWLKQATRQAQLEQQVEAHRQEQARVAQTLGQLDPQAMFYEVDSEKDQIVAHLRIALHNSALWARDHYFGPALSPCHALKPVAYLLQSGRLLP
jgi:hypothetical protein